MVAAKYPNIEDGEASVDSIINGLRNYPTLTPILGHVLVYKPQTIREFTSFFKSLNSRYQSQQPIRTTHSNFTRVTGNYVQISNNCNTRPDYGRHPPNNRFIPFNKLCSHHKALGTR